MLLNDSQKVFIKLGVIKWHKLWPDLSEVSPPDDPFFPTAESVCFGDKACINIHM